MKTRPTRQPNNNNNASSISTTSESLPQKLQNMVIMKQTIDSDDEGLNNMNNKNKIFQPRADKIEKSLAWSDIGDDSNAIIPKPYKPSIYFKRNNNNNNNNITSDRYPYITSDRYHSSDESQITLPTQQKRHYKEESYIHGNNNIFPFPHSQNIDDDDDDDDDDYDLEKNRMHRYKKNNYNGMGQSFVADKRRKRKRDRNGYDPHISAPEPKRRKLDNDMLSFMSDIMPKMMEMVQSNVTVQPGANYINNIESGAIGSGSYFGGNHHHYAAKQEASSSETNEDDDI